MEKITEQAEKVRRAWRIAEDDYADIIERSEKAMRYVLNDPYDSVDKANAIKYKKPLLKYSIMIPYLAILIGNEQLSRRRALIKTRSLDPKQIALVEIVQRRWNAINDEQDVEEKIQITFSDGLIMPVGGYIERSFKMNDMGFLDYHYEVANNMRVKLCPETKTSDYRLKKCLWLIKEGWERAERLQDKYNIAQEDFDEIGKEKWYDKLSGYIKRFLEGGFSGSTDYDEENDLYRILEMQERTEKRMVRAFNPREGSLLQIPQEEYKQLKLENPDLEFLSEGDSEVIHITTIIPALNDLLVKDEDSKVPTKNFDLFRLSSYGYTNQVTEATSLVEILEDIQDDINKGKSQNRDYLSQILAGAIIIKGSQEKEAYELFKKKGNQPNLVVQTKSPNAEISKLEIGHVPPEILINTADSTAHGDKIAQMPAAMQGRSERSGESGKLFDSKVDRAAAAINPYYKNVSNLRKMLVEDFIDNFSYVYSEYDRLIDIKGKSETGENVWDQVFINLKMASEVINDVRNLSMYVELDEGEDNITAKEENFNKLMALTEVISSVNPALVDIITILESAPIQGADKMVEYAKGILGQQGQEANNQKMIEEEKARLENAKTASEISNNKIAQG